MKGIPKINEDLDVVNRATYHLRHNNDHIMNGIDQLPNLATKSVPTWHVKGRSISGVLIIESPYIATAALGLRTIYKGRRSSACASWSTTHV